MLNTKGRIVRTEGVCPPEGDIADIKVSYKYLRIPQENGNLEEATRKSATAKYFQRERQVLRSQLNGRNNVWAINTSTLSVIR